MCCALVNDKPLPPNVKTSLAGENITKEFSKNPKNAKMIENIESFEIKEDKVYIKIKAKTGAADTPKIEDAALPKDEAPKKAETKDASPPKEESKPKEATAPKAAA